MNQQTTVSALLGTGVLVTLGTWAEGKPVTIKPIVGGVFLALSLSALSEASPEFAGRLALLIVAVAMFRYVPPILSKSGLVKK